jgi:hypothetical protein
MKAKVTNSCMEIDQRYIRKGRKGSNVIIVVLRVDYSFKS